MKPELLLKPADGWGVAEKHFCESKNLWSEGGRDYEADANLFARLPMMYGNSAPLLNQNMNRKLRHKWRRELSWQNPEGCYQIKRISAASGANKAPR